MLTMSLTPEAQRAYDAARQAAQLMSIDPDTAPVPGEYAGQEGAYRQGLRDEQQGTAPGSNQSAPPSPPPPAKPAAVTAAEQREQTYQRFLVSLKKQPVQTIHDAAVDLIVQIDRAMGKTPLIWGRIQPKHKEIQEQLLNARSRLAEGDSLVSLADDESKEYRKAAYVAAYDLAHQAGEQVAIATHEDWFLVTAAEKVVGTYVAGGQAVLREGEKVVDKVASTYVAVGKEAVKAGGAVAGYAKDAVGQVGSTVKVVGYVLAGGLALGLIVYASQAAGKRR